MRVCLVYDRLNKIGGAEHVLQAFHKIFPDADWFTSFWDPKRAPFSKGWNVTSFPYLHTHHELFPWLMPFIFESYDFSGYDLVISIGSAESKGIITRPGTIHLNYCLTPTRYLYSHKEEYLSNPLYRLVGKYLRMWDLVASTRPDQMIAISTQVKKRIKHIYNRESEVIFPPVNTKRFQPTRMILVDNYFLVVSRLVAYKRIDILVRAANQSKKNLVVIGTGSEYQRLKKLAGPTVNLLGHVEDDDLPKYYHNCLAYLQANEEDFGISMCEAQAAGRPVIAYKEGGAKDIVVPGKTGILLEDSSVSSFAKVLAEFDTMSFVSRDCQQNASRFDQDKWIKQIKERIDKLCQTQE
ncbi:glycosyltransferase [Candidatus Woesebacteria bacterium]|nr:glycosyltransferase [Candidatus Woesebacteria bacterium]